MTLPAIGIVLMVMGTLIILAVAFIAAAQLLRGTDEDQDTYY